MKDPKNKFKSMMLCDPDAISELELDIELMEYVRGHDVTNDILEIIASQVGTFEYEQE